MARSTHRSTARTTVTHTRAADEQTTDRVDGGGALDRELRRMAVLHEREVAATRRGLSPAAQSRAALAVVLRGGASSARASVASPHRVRAPKTAEPIRTTVAPSATAASRSRLMPIDSSTADAVPGAPEARTSSRSVRRSA